MRVGHEHVDLRAGHHPSFGPGSGAEGRVVPCADIDAVVPGAPVDPAPRPDVESSTSAAAPVAADLAKARDAVQRAMTEGAGVLRSPPSLAAAGAEVRALCETLRAVAPSRHAGELVNLVTVAGAVLRAADVRTETRGAHARRDHPAMVDGWRRRIVHRRAVLPRADDGAPRRAGVRR